MTDCERINPYDSDSRPKSEQVREMFDNIAPAYDFMNRAMTFGLDRLWLRRLLAEAAAGSPKDIADLATGTGDVALAMARRMPGAKVTGLDLSEGMIDIGRRKIERAGLAGRIELICGDSLAMPFDSGSFDAITVAYGVRNFADLLAGYREMARVLKPGGTLTVIELSTPASPVVRPFYRLYTRHIIPLMGRMVSKDVRAYSYLPESIAAVPQRADMTALMEQAGFTDTAWRTLTFGTCAIYTGRRP